jgi:hypothetical protein
MQKTLEASEEDLSLDEVIHIQLLNILMMVGHGLQNLVLDA